MLYDTPWLTEPTTWSAAEEVKQVEASSADSAASTTDSTHVGTPASEVSPVAPAPKASSGSALDDEALAWEADVCHRFSSAIGIPAGDDGREMVRRMLRMLLLCGYPPEDLDPVLALSLAQLDRVLGSCSDQMPSVEKAAVACLQTYCAHAYLMDEYCPLKYWQSRIFPEYCSLRELNLALMKVMLCCLFVASYTQ